MELANHWRSFFVNWPDSMAKRGLVVNDLNEAMPFKSFMLAENMLLLERTNPDPLGSRFIMLSYGSISSVKLVDPMGTEALQKLGFQGKLTNG